MPNEMSKALSTAINQPRFQFELDSINRDFRFLCLEQPANGKWWGAGLLDKALDDCKAKAVVFAYGRMAFLMFDLTQNIEEIKQRLRLDEALQAVKISQVSAIAQPPVGENQSGLYGKWLAQILINSLVSLQPKGFAAIHNLGGQFYWIVSTKPSQIIALKVGFNHQSLLMLQAVNFSAQQAGWVDSKPQYVMEKGRYLKRVFGDEIKRNNLVTFVAKERTFKGNAKKARIPFLAIDSLPHFQQSKMGIWNQLQHRIHTFLKDYLQIHFETLAIHHRKKLDKAPSLKKRAQKLKTQRVCLVDAIQDDTSQPLIQQMVAMLAQEAPGLSVECSTHTQPGCLNIRLVHPKEHYEQCGLVDPYLHLPPDHAVQHLYPETWSGASATTDKTRQAILNVCLKEAQLKHDFIQGQLSVFDWPSYLKRQAIDGDVVFLMPCFPALENRQSRSLLPEEMGLNWMCVSPTGKLTTGHIDTDILFQTPKTQQTGWLEQARALWQPKETWLGDMKGMVIYSDQQLVFYESNMATLPDYQRIGDRLAEVQAALPLGWQTPEAWRGHITRFSAATRGLSEQDIKKLEHLKSLLDSGQSNEFNRSFVGRTMGTVLVRTSQLYAAFDAFLVNEGIHLRFSKKEQNLLLHLPAQIELNVYRRDDFYGYSLGVPKGNVQSVLQNGNKIRWFKSIVSQEIDIERIVALLDVDFVQAQQAGSTLPFMMR